MLMADYPPDETHGGAIRMAKLVSELPRGTVCWFASAPLRSGKLPAGLEEMPFKFADYSLRRPSRFGLHWLRDDINLRWMSIFQARAAAAWARTQQVQAVWVIMQEKMIVSGPLAAKFLGVPFHVSVHDDLSYFMQGRLKPSAFEKIEALFLAAYQAAKSRDVVCDSMRRFYCEKTGVDADVVLPAHPNSRKSGPSIVDTPAKAHLRIHHAGMLYDANQLRRFGEQLLIESNEGRFPSFEFTLSGPEHFKNALPAKPFRWVGWLDEAALDAQLKASDILYLQHPFDLERRKFSSTSFPGKLAHYLQSQRNLIAHAPEYSSITAFFDQYKLRFCLNQLSPEEAARAFVLHYRNATNENSHPGKASAIEALRWERNREILFSTLKALTDNG